MFGVPILPTCTRKYNRDKRGTKDAQNLISGSLASFSGCSIISFTSQTVRQHHTAATAGK